MHPFLLPQISPLLIVISGLSGAGKDSALNELRRRGRPFHFVVTATDRPQRPGEVHGRDYIFLSTQEFEQMIAQDELLEYARVYDQYKGVPKSQVRLAIASGKDVVMRVDVQGAASIRHKYPEAVLIFLATEDERSLARRLKGRRADTQASLQLRLETAGRELEHLMEFDYLVINRDGALAETVDTIEAIIEAEHHRTQPRKVTL